MSDIEKRLRDYAENYSAHTYLAGMCTEAAARIKELEHLLERLPYDTEADIWTAYGDQIGIGQIGDYVRECIAARARLALSKRPSGEPESTPGSAEFTAGLKGAFSEAVSRAVSRATAATRQNGEPDPVLTDLRSGEDATEGT